MDEHLQAQIDAAAKFEEHFVPALFDQWTDLVTGAAGVDTGQRVLDVACRTGCLAREARRKVGEKGHVVGSDASEAMITVASRIAPEIEWKVANPHQLPFDDASFDAVVSQFGLVYFKERVSGLREMMRVLKPGGKLAVAAWESLDDVPAYAILIALLQHLVGRRAADVLRIPFSLGSVELLKPLFDEAGITAEFTRHEGMARHPSVRAWVLTDVKGWFPLVDVVLKKEEYDALIEEAERALHSFIHPNGTVEFPIGIHLATATR
ncbi:MAG TPA: class I SAM-dependent methyltransferase [Candidatus Krumholzibacteria bacterium]|nr:class I SAM-dependent methyltransferase [Candidatus Krumholzibacteria bacterium]